jgi:hypothetical protein
MKRRFDPTLAGWAGFPMVVEGDAYYSYSFIAADPDPRGTNVTLSVTAVGDLDGDGTPSTRTTTYSAPGYSFQPNPEPWLDPHVF